MSKCLMFNNCQNQNLNFIKLLDIPITQPNKKQVFIFPQAKLNFFHRFSAVNYNSVPSFFPGRQVLEIFSC
jgi:hypothetical protein